MNLSPQHVAVLSHFANGKTAKGVGRELGITEETVKTHTKVIRRRLQAKTMAHAVAKAIASGAVEIKVS